MTKRLTTQAIRGRKGARKLVVLTAYTAPVARILDAHVDVLMVGDSLGMVLYGMDSTLGVTLEMMIAHARAVVNASAQACVVADLPFGSYQASPEDAFRAGARMLAETGCTAVKLEGGAEMAPTVRFLVQRGIPVMGHVGLMPQHVHALGGYRTQGRNEAERAKVLADAQAVEEAGAFAVVLEAMQEALAREVTARVTIPTIGIGASPACDGQVLVVDDMAGFTTQKPSFVKQYALLGESLERAAKTYAEEVRAGVFPGKEHCFMK